MTETPPPIMTTTTFTSTTSATDTTMETLFGALTAIFAALFLATLFLLTRNKSSGNPYNSPTRIQQTVNPTQTPPQPPSGGQSISPGQFCTRCGAGLQPGVRFCSRCGSQQ